ncbi:2-amino-4-hydroxy-6-hydroxymethyldihydropteridine diphosphokinase [Granulicoccus phenolivorans]|uniref:2-amino-4-hydroxy-6- hydroxymethyldihydropteridine diphosphokinase n=1 Tax=Granulicoccus phenolivorans TaxID=266854 RepID=UPI000424B5E7|nr:2-amino-4-hydroxy-6-hydroxymethyldihydropteridine diphosphokinase [Granulicoccus phenolivorans]
MSTIPGAFDVDTLSGMKPLTQVVYSVGSNLGDRLENLQAAVAALRDTPDLMIAAVSPVYETAPVDAPAGSPDFLNIVVVGDTTQEPLTLLDRAQAIEEAFGRVRTIEHAPRTLDVDLVMVGRRTVDTDRLVLPHPDAHQRAFVLIPWLAVDPEAELPGKGRVADLIAATPDQGVRLRADLVIED